MYKQAEGPTKESEIARNATNLATCCVLCSHSCAVRVDVADGKIVEVRADETSPISQGYICNKGFTLAHYVEHEQRVKEPLRRRTDGTFEPVSWDTALGDISRRLLAIRERHTARAIGLVGVGGQANHLDGPYALGFLHALGSPSWFNAFAQEKTQHNLVDQWMCDASPIAYLHSDSSHTRYQLVLGSNPRISNRGHNATETFKALAKDPACTVVVVDPRETETTRGADLHLRVKPGTDTYLLLGLCALIVQRDWVDQAFLDARTTGLEEVRTVLGGLDVTGLASRCGVDLSLLTRVAEGFAKTRPAAILHDLGVEQAPFSTLNAYLIRLLSLLTGNLGRRGGNLYLEGPNPPDPRHLERGPTERSLVAGIPAIRALGSYAMFSPSLVPEEVLSDHPHHLRALIVEGANPLLSYADTAKWREAIGRLELLVVIDPAMTETARRADYVLPTPVGYEKWEVTSFPKHWPEIHTQVRPPVVKGPPLALPEAEIYARLAERMDLFGAPPRALYALSRLATRGVGRTLLVVATLALAAARRGGAQGVQNRLIFWLYRLLGPRLSAPALSGVWLICLKNATQRRQAVLRTLGESWRWRSPFALADELFARVLAHPEGVEIARLSDDDNLGDHIGFADGRVRLAVPEMLGEITRALASPRARDAAYPLTLSAGLRTRWTANTIQRDPRWRKGKGPHCSLSMSPADAAALGVVEGESVRLETPRGHAVLPAALDDRMLPGHVAAPNGFGMQRDEGGKVIVDGVNLNELTDAADRDPFTGCPHHKSMACRVTRAGASLSH
jgi:anaerobic selenocysteine-containing dehydrogenase